MTRSAAIVLPALLIAPTVGFVLIQAAASGTFSVAGAAAALGALGFGATYASISRMAPKFTLKLFGFDINKRGTLAGNVKIPESLGLVSATVYLVCLCFMHVLTRAPSVALYTAALATVTLMTLLGFADDVLDLRWRHKLMLPLIACLPLVVIYTGSTSIMVPRPLHALLGVRLLDIGLLYHVYMMMLTIFCPNSINILAGINGLEAGQTLVICCFVLVHNAMQLTPTVEKDDVALLQANNLLSMELLFPLLGCCWALLAHNWYPSRVFVGDTFCYSAGMALAVASILGHYSETLLVMFIPQIINFLYSSPQLFGLLPCPRHRLPKYNEHTGKLEPIRSNLNLTNLLLLIFGPMTEYRLFLCCMALQVLSCSAGIGARYLLLHYLL